MAGPATFEEVNRIIYNTARTVLIKELEIRLDQVIFVSRDEVTHDIHIGAYVAGRVMKQTLPMEYVRDVRWDAIREVLGHFAVVYLRAIHDDREEKKKSHSRPSYDQLMDGYMRDTIRIHSLRQDVELAKADATIYMIAVFLAAFVLGVAL